ncbi:nuclease-related domain-containing protein [Salisediminibacterium beveridgei]|uniref:NERD domain-containing protein n=1 Tax=Salisediminibacterium beveridgei TaxID=632773 RepID=A0A1D7QRT8_9BACI|nr:nuclease-related domain-containing protein [Salisediminibacterium beveridgei]AOM81727.1 hypothetical protein BBEV_0333 [Salisediminibacterium beveridgei]
MIVKPRNQPLDIHIIKALQRRLPHALSQEPFLKEQLAQFLAGFTGEKELDYVLEGLSFDFPDSRIIQDLRLAVGANHVQIDTLALTRKGVFLLEVKHLSGVVRLDTVNCQMIQLKDGQSRTMKDPFGQMSTAGRKFRNWFTANRIASPPVFQLLVFTNDHMELDAASATGFVRRWDVIDAMLHQSHGQPDVMDAAEIKELGRLLVKHHRPQHPHYQFGKYQSYHAKVNPGVYCPRCGEYILHKRATGWYCGDCAKTRQLAATSALTDFALTTAPFISCREAKAFLQERDRHIIYRTLEKTGLPRTKNNARVIHYDLRPLYLNLT